MSRADEIDIGVLQHEIDALAERGEITSTRYLQGSKVFIQSGQSDKVVHPDVARAGDKLYADYGADI